MGGCLVACLLGWLVDCLVGWFYMLVCFMFVYFVVCVLQITLLVVGMAGLGFFYTSFDQLAVHVLCMFQPLSGLGYARALPIGQAHQLSGPLRMSVKLSAADPNLMHGIIL